MSIDTCEYQDELSDIGKLDLVLLLQNSKYLVVAVPKYKGTPDIAVGLACDLLVA